jgi:hypothetical protein
MDAGQYTQLHLPNAHALSLYQLLNKRPPTSEAFVKIGQHVNQGDTICIVEAMKIMNQIKPNLAGWVPFKIVSDSPALHPRWPPLLKIDISLNGQNCFIL